MSDATSEAPAAAMENMAREKITIPEQSTAQESADAASKAAASPAHAAENAEKREKLPTPEQSAVPAVAEIPKKETPVIHISTKTHHSNVISTETFKQAEENLAGYFGQKFDPALTKGLQLTLSNVLSDGDGKIGGTTLKLCFTGERIEANFAELSRELIASLQEHPLIAKLLRENHTVLIEQANNAEKGQMLHMHLPNFTAEQYAQFINSLGAAPAAAPSVKDKARAEQVATILEKAATSLRDQASTAPAPASEVPQTTLAAPVIQMGVQDPSAELKRA